MSEASAAGPADASARASTLLVAPGGAEIMASAARMFAGRTPAANALQSLAAAAGAGDRATAQCAARMAWGMAQQRGRAAAKLGELGGVLLFDSDGLQMASSLATARYHASILAGCGANPAIDLTGGIGVDAISFALAGLNVRVYERDPVRFRFLAKNVALAGVAARVDAICADSSDAPIGPRDCVYIDPPRRGERGRWDGAGAAGDLVLRCIEARPAAILSKMHPSFDVRDALRLGSAVEYISSGGECKEALLRFGSALTADAAATRSAVLLDTGDRLDAGSAPAAKTALRCLEGSEGSRLFEPDPAVICAGLVNTLANQAGLARFERAVDYLIGDSEAATPFARSYRILATVPFRVKAVQQWLSSHRIGRLTVKKRGVSDEAEALRSFFRLGGGGSAVLIVTRCGRSKWAVLAEDASATAGG